MAKKLIVNTAVCDLRRVQEETLDAYDSIRINAAVLIQNDRSRLLMAGRPVELNCATTLSCEDDVHISIINGKTTLTGRNTPNGKQYLVINGKLTVTPDAGDALRQYMGMTVNGKVYCPESLATVVAGLSTINGKLCAYPGDAVVLSGSNHIDRTFLLRAQPRLYWCDRTLIATDPRLDGEALADTGARFDAPKAVLSEALAESLAPLFTPDTELVVLPDKACLVEDDLTLTPAALRRYGSCIYVLGDVTVSDECAGALEELEALVASGTITLPEALAEEFYDIPQFEAGSIRVLRGHLLQGLPRLQVDKDLLERFPEGVACVDCVKVLLSPELEPDTIAKKLTLCDCVEVSCTRLQQNAVNAVAQDVVHIALTDAPHEEDEEDAGTVRVNATEYVL